MSAHGTLIYGGWLVRTWLDEAIANGAVYELNGRIVAVGSYREMTERFPKAKRVGDSSYIVIPGFVNAHSHGRGLTTFQMGHMDEPLETRLIDISIRTDRAEGRLTSTARSNLPTNPYLDTLYSCLKQIASGITTTLHSSAYVEGDVEAHAEATQQFVKAYRDSGIRCAYALGIRDRSTLAFADDRQFMLTLPRELRRSSELTDTADYITFQQYYELVHELSASYPDINFQLGPWNPAFCSDELLQAISEASRSRGWRIQTHLAETRYQAEFSRKKYGKSWARHLSDMGMLSPRFSGAHCVWFDGDDIALMKQYESQVVHNPGSNLRLLSGIAPIPRFLDADVHVAFGIDSLGMNDDEDIFQDLRLSRLIHGSPRIDAKFIPARIMLDMATKKGAVVAGLKDVGSLDEGNRADVVLLSRPEIEGVAADLPIADLILMRAKPSHIKTVIIGGKIIIGDGRWRDYAPLKILERLGRSKVSGRRRSKVRTLFKEALVNYLRNW
jgi:cytosine/adenosine deaminase-related metal-dependent hydrolase